MEKFEHFAWCAFEATGGVKEYLKYKALKKDKTDFEAGVEIGVDKNIGNSDKNHEIR